MSGKDTVDEKRRCFLRRATCAVGGLGLAATSLPFVEYWLPSADTEAAGGPVKVDLSQLKPGQQLTVAWRGKPVWIVRRTKEMLDTLPKLTSHLRDPNSEVEQQPSYAQNIYRASHPEYLILVGVCTHLGCTPTYRPDVGGISPDWLGGFYCPCHGSKFDLSGRVYTGVPAPINLEVPPYVFLNDHEVLIGVDKVIETG
jgi:ubiquinol-cytochrome c reductase iron-sulfur subunit